MSALDQPKPKPLIVRIGPRKKIDEALRKELLARGLKISSEVSLGVESSVLSTLDTYLWRDIQYFLQQEYSEYTAVEKALERLRANPVFAETVENLVNKSLEGEN